MTPGARVSAAITVLDAVFAGQRAEQALSNWARNSRFAGSKDRAAVRDLVFDALRRKASSTALGGGASGRAVMIGSLAQDDVDLATLFCGEGHAPLPLSSEEQSHLEQPPALSPADVADLPEWLWPVWQNDLQQEADASARALRQRAPLFLRVNRRRGTVDAAVAALANDGIGISAHPLCAGCLRVETNPRRVKTSRAFKTGLVEIQDAASQMAVGQMNIPSGAKVLDYCAGGGGKALAIADQFDCDITAHDVAEPRTRDIGPRAQRAGVSITVMKTAQLATAGPFDCVVVDAPCSGSGTWRRNPEAKWQLTQEDLFAFNQLQGEVLAKAAELTAAQGVLYYMTCSVLATENMRAVDAFVARHPDWTFDQPFSLLPSDLSDGFFLCQLTRNGEKPTG